MSLKIHANSCTSARQWTRNCDSLTWGSHAAHFLCKDASGCDSGPTAQQQRGQEVNRERVCESLQIQGTQTLPDLLNLLNASNSHEDEWLSSPKRSEISSAEAQTGELLPSSVYMWYYGELAPFSSKLFSWTGTLIFGFRYLNHMTDDNSENIFNILLHLQHPFLQYWFKNVKNCE